MTNTFDGGNRLTNIVDSVNGSIARNLDGLDNLLSEATPQGTVSYTYRADGRRQTMTVPGQPEISYGYDNAGHLTSISQGSTSVYFGYDSDGRRTSLTLPNGITAAYGYDAAAQLTTIAYQGSALSLADLEYSYDLAGRRVGVSGSLASEQLPAAVTSAQYNANNQLTQWGSTQMTYDLNGNTLNDGTNSYVWDARNWLVSANSGAAAFSYDPLGRRISRTLLSTTTSYLYDGANAVQEQVGGSVTANMLTGGVDEHFQRTDGTGSYSYLTDALGSTVALTNSADNSVEQYSYGPYGLLSATGSNANSYTYTGRESDGLGIDYYRARYYNPTTGRFLSEDPIGFAGSGTNLYAYASDSPTNFVDPSGLLTVYVWNSAGSTADGWGHASMMLDDGTYISWWPNCTWGGCGNLDSNVPAYQGRTPQDDMAGEGERGNYRYPDHAIKIEGLDEAAIKAWWNKYRKDDPNWKTVGRNCSSTVANGLKAGGAPDTGVSNSHLWWTPEDVLQFANDIAAGKDWTNGMPSRP